MEDSEEDDNDWGKCQFHPFSLATSEAAKDLQFLWPGNGTTGCSMWMIILRCVQCHKSWFGCRLCQWKSPITGTNPRNSNRSSTALLDPVYHHSRSPLHLFNLCGNQEDEDFSVMQSSSISHVEAENHPTILEEVLQAPFQDESAEQHLSVPESVVDKQSLSNLQSVFDDVDQSDLNTSSILESVQSPHLRSYLEQENKERLMGCRANATNALKDDRLREVIPGVSNTVTVEGAHFLNTCAQVYLHLSVADRNRFNWILNSVRKIPQADWAAIMGPVVIPSTNTEAARLYQTGNHSVLETQPIPKLWIVRTVGDDNKFEELVVAEPRDILQFLFSILPTDVLEEMTVVDKTTEVPDAPATVSTYFESASFLNDLENVVAGLKGSTDVMATIVLAFKLWSDAWDPVSVKQNRNGIWSLVWTLMIGERDYVFPVAIGSKGHDHHPALREFLTKLDALGKYPTFRHTDSGKNIRVKLVFGLYNVDRLEKGELWSGQHHATLRCKCFRVVYGFSDGYHPKYASCENCLAKVVTELCGIEDKLATEPDSGEEAHHEEHTCLECANYSPVPAVNGQVTAGRVPLNLRRVVPATTQDPPAAPNELSLQSCMYGNPSHPPPGRSMGEASQTYECIQVSQTFLVVAAQYAVFQCWKGAIAKKKTFMLWTDACGIGKKLATKLFNVASFHRKNKTEEFCDVFQPGLLPPTWLHPSMSILKFLDAPMHLLFLGIVSKIADMMDEWFSLRGLKKSLSEHVSKTCDRLGKLGLQWLLLRKFGVTVLSRGSWVSEQYVAFSKIILIPYAGLVFTTRAPKGQVRVVLRVLDSCSCLLSLLMQRSVTDASTERATLAIKAYLSAIDALGKVIFETKKKRAATKRTASAALLPERASHSQRVRPASNSPLGSSGGHVDMGAEMMESGNQEAPTRLSTGNHEDGNEVHFRDESGTAAANAAVGVSASAAATVADFAEKLLEKKGIPISLSNPNHASLPNLPMSMKSHGPPVDQWEGKDGCEKTIIGMKPFFHGVCVVDGGQLLAAFERYYRSKVINEMNGLLACQSSLVEANGDGTARERLTDVRRYANIGQVLAILEKVEPLTAFLYAVHLDEDTTASVICVAIRSFGHADTLYCLTMTEATALTDADDLFFARDLLTFCKVAVEETEARVPRIFDPSEQPSQLITPLVLIPGSCVWRDEAYSSSIEFPFDDLYTVATDNYSVLLSDLFVHQKTSLAPSLWLQDGALADDDASSEVDWLSCSVAELRAELARRVVIRTSLGMPRIAVSGNKADLASRLADDDKLPYLVESGGGGTTVPASSQQVPLGVPGNSGTWGEMTVPELKAEIRKRNENRTGIKKLLLSGNKGDLVERLLLDDTGGESN